MANLQRLLGTMLMSRMGGKIGMGLGGPLGMLMMTGFGRRALRGKAGLAALGYLAYRAYRDRGGSASAGDATAAAAGNGASSGKRSTLGGQIGDFVDNLTGESGRPGESLGDRISRMLDPRPAPEETVEDQKALLLIRAMITAASSDGTIKPEERERILSRLNEAGCDDEERKLVAAEFEKPMTVDALVAQVSDPETARQVYLASRAAVEGGTRTQRAYLDYLRQRLDLPKEEAEEVEEIIADSERQ